MAASINGNDGISIYSHTLNEILRELRQLYSESEEGDRDTTLRRQRLKAGIEYIESRIDVIGSIYKEAIKELGEQVFKLSEEELKEFRKQKNKLLRLKRRKISDPKKELVELNKAREELNKEKDISNAKYNKLSDRISYLMSHFGQEIRDIVREYKEKLDKLVQSMGISSFFRIWRNKVVLDRVRIGIEEQEKLKILAKENGVILEFPGRFLIQSGPSGDKIKDNWAELSNLGSHSRDGTKFYRFCDMVTEIPLSEFPKRFKRFGKRVPPHAVFRFLLYHEIAHRINNHNFLIFDLPDYRDLKESDPREFYRKRREYRKETENTANDYAYQMVIAEMAS